VVKSRERMGRSELLATSLQEQIVKPTDAP
jgi:hypothetical protein